ncbi:MAG: hypothetical protein C0514_04290 [Candidatus Puniceispirillum sp.]|nr:hypothetical protein [Candidatus Puniceispirillum sp.]
MSHMTQVNTVSSMQAFKTGLLMAIPRDRHTFGALLKTVLFCGGGWAVLMGLWFLYAPRLDNGMIPLSISVWGVHLSISTFAVCVVSVFPFVDLYAVRSALKERKDTPYFCSLMEGVAARALVILLLIHLFHFVNDSLFAECAWYVSVLFVCGAIVLTPYIGMVIVHLVVSGRIDLGGAWHIFRRTFWGSVFVFLGILFTFLVVAFLCEVFLSFCIGLAGGILSTNIRADLLLLTQDFAALSEKLPVAPCFVPYAWMYVLPMGVYHAVLSWGSVGLYGALTFLYKRAVTTERARPDQKEL